MTIDARTHSVAPLAWAHAPGCGAIRLDWTRLDQLCDGEWTRSIVGEA